MKIFVSVWLLFEFTGCINSNSDSFQKIEYAEFDVNSYRTKSRDSVYINLYYSVSNDGLMVINNQDDYHNTHTYYSFRLTKDEVNKLNSTFNQAHKLKSYLERTKLDDSSFYAGSYDFFRVTYSNGIVDSVCIIQPFMTSDLENTYTFLDSLIYIREDRKAMKRLDIPFSFKTSLKNCYSQSSYLPKIENRPPFKLQ